MDIKQFYREETELDVYDTINLDLCFSNEYVKWLELKILESNNNIKLTK